MGYKYDVEDIIAQGADLIRRRGYHNTGIKDILEISGIPKGSFYNFFESKEYFALEVVKYYGESARQMISERLQPNGSDSGAARLRKLYGYLLDSNEEDNLANGCLITNMSMEVCGNNERIAAEVDAQFRGWIEQIAVTVREAQQEGSITSEFSPEHIAELLHTGIAGGFSRMKVTRSRAWLDQWLDMTFRMLEGTPATVS